MGLKIGDVVTLKSGGPAMTVGGEAGNGEVLVAWHLPSGDLQNAACWPAMLRLVSSDEPEAFGIPEALMKAKDDEAQRLRDAADAKWSEEQIRYAHTTGYVTDEAPSAGVTRQSDG